MGYIRRLTPTPLTMLRFQLAVTAFAAVVPVLSRAQRPVKVRMRAHTFSSGYLRAGGG
jgi:hypothetical protein